MATNHSEFALHVTGKDGKKVVVLPGEDIPAGVKVTNPYVLGDEEDGGGDDDRVGPPPLEGKGSGVTAWRKYAAECEVDVDGLDRDEIVEALRDGGFAVE